MSRPNVDQLLAAVARTVQQSVGQRSYSAHHVLGESLLTHMVCHELLSNSPELRPRLWLGYRPWPEESGESIAFWIDGQADQAPIALEVHVDDPADDSPLESSGVWGKIIADVLKFATAIACGGLGRGYVCLFGELKYDPNDQRINQFPLLDVGQVLGIETDSLLSHSVMDEGFFEELMHPHEVTPETVEVQLLACDTGQEIGFWLWAVNVPQ